MNETQQLLNYVSNIEDIVDMFASVKPVEFWLVDKKILYITLEEELYLYEKQILVNKFAELTGTSNNDFFETDTNDLRTFLIKL